MAKNKIIETDKDTDEVDNYSYLFDKNKSPFFVRDSPCSVFELVRRYKKNNLLDLMPDFQRNFIWKLDQQSKFIESIILNFPIPPLYINEKIDGTWLIIDGLQRTKTLIDFLENKLTLKNLKLLPSLNGYKFKELELSLQVRIEDRKLNLQLLPYSTDIRIIYQIFDRINTGGTKLNKQEIRNGIMQGKSTLLLKKLAEKAIFKKATDGGVSSRRMKDMEFVLRFMSFQIFDYNLDYKGVMNDFLDKSMLKINSMSEVEITQLENKFLDVMKWTFNCFENNNFRTKGDRKRSSIMVGLFDAVCYSFSKKTSAMVSENQQKIRSNYETLTESLKELKLLGSSSNTKEKLKQRFELTEKILFN